MVPLTSSLYVPGKLNEEDQVLVEVGADYFVGKNYDGAKDYCDRKWKMLNENGKKVAEIIAHKRVQLQKVYDEYKKRMDDF